MWKYLGLIGKGPGAHQLAMLPWFILVDLDLRFKMRDLKLELKVLVGCFFFNLISFLSFTGNGSVKIIVVVTSSCIYPALGTAELRISWRYLDFLNRATFSEGMKCVFWLYQ